MQCAQVFMLWIGSLESDILGLKPGFANSFLDYFIQIKSQQGALGKEIINSVSTMLEGLSESLTETKEFVVFVTVIFDEH